MRLLCIFSPPFNASYKSCFPNQAHIVGTLKLFTVLSVELQGNFVCFSGTSMTLLGTCLEPQCKNCDQNEYQDKYTKEPKCQRQPYCDPSKPAEHNEPKLYHPLRRLFFHVAKFTSFCLLFSQTGTLVFPSITAKNEPPAYAKTDITVRPKNVTHVCSTLPANQDIRLNPKVRRLPLMLLTIFLH